MSDYLTKQMLSKIGYQFDINDLEDWEVEAYSIIASTFSKEEDKDLKKSANKRARK